MNPAGILSTAAIFANVWRRAIIGFVQACNWVSPMVALFNLSCLGEFMIESIQFKNFKALRDATLPLGRFTLIVGPNGSGKSTAIKALEVVSNPGQTGFSQLVTADLRGSREAKVNIKFNYGEPNKGVFKEFTWGYDTVRENPLALENGASEAEFRWSRVFSLDAQAISSPVKLVPNDYLRSDGSHLAGVLDQLRDRVPERFDALTDALGNCLPEFDRILFDTPEEGMRAFSLRTRKGGHKIQAPSLSQGTLLAIAILTLAYLPDSPRILCLEEPDRGIHPRLLRDVQDAIYRLAYPEDHGEAREPVQVIATTHSPYFLDLYRDHPEEVVIANKTEEGTKFERLSDQPYLDEVLGDSHLGEIWYTGILGGVPVHS